MLCETCRFAQTIVGVGFRCKNQEFSSDYEFIHPLGEKQPCPEWKFGRDKSREVLNGGTEGKPFGSELPWEGEEKPAKKMHVKFSLWSKETEEKMARMVSDAVDKVCRDMVTSKASELSPSEEKPPVPEKAEQEKGTEADRKLREFLKGLGSGFSPEEVPVLTLGYLRGWSDKVEGQSPQPPPPYINMGFDRWLADEGSHIPEGKEMNAARYGFIAGWRMKNPAPSEEEVGRAWRKYLRKATPMENTRYDACLKAFEAAWKARGEDETVSVPVESENEKKVNLLHLRSGEKEITEVEFVKFKNHQLCIWIDRTNDLYEKLHQKVSREKSVNIMADALCTYLDDASSLVRKVLEDGDGERSTSEPNAKAEKGYHEWIIEKRIEARGGKPPSFDDLPLVWERPVSKRVFLAGWENCGHESWAAWCHRHGEADWDVTLKECFLAGQEARGENE